MPRRVSPSLLRAADRARETAGRGDLAERNARARQRLAVVLRGRRASFGFTRPGEDEFWAELLGNGVFLVVAWVGLWYPLDLLFMARQPAKREIRLLTEVLRLPVVVQSQGAAAAP